MNPCNSIMFILLYPAFLIGIALFSPQVHAKPALHTKLNEVDCQFKAHHGNRETWGDVCASFVESIHEKYPISSYKAQCSDFQETTLSDHFHLIQLSPALYLMQFRCNSGAYNKSFLYFLFDQSHAKRSIRGTKRLPPPLIQFPNDPELLSNTDIQKRWKLDSSQTEIFKSNLNLKTWAMTSYRKGLGDGSIGYYTKYKFNKNTGIPKLLFSSTRILEDHSDGYFFDPNKDPSGKGWISFNPRNPIEGSLISFQ